MRPSLPAEKKHYRKGLALGLTIAETFCIVVFILLLACAVLLRVEQTERDIAEAARDSARVDLLITQEMVRGDGKSWANADAWFERSRELGREKEAQRLRAEKAEHNLADATARAVEAERLLQSEGVSDAALQRLREQAEELRALRDSLERSSMDHDKVAAEAEALAREVANSQDVVSRMVEPNGRAIAEREGVDQEEAELVNRQATRANGLEDTLLYARKVIAEQDREIQEFKDRLQGDAALADDSLRVARLQTDTFRTRAIQAEQERDDAQRTASYFQTQVEQLGQGTGIDPPPCWLDQEGDPEYIFRVELSDHGMRLFNISPDHRAETDLEAMHHAAAIEEGRVYDPATFLGLTLPFYNIGTSRTVPFGPSGCRFWIRPIDLTGDRKDVFRERESQLWRRFWFRW